MADRVAGAKPLAPVAVSNIVEQIINSPINNEQIYTNKNETQINTKNIMDISQKILKNLEYMNNLDIKTEESDSGVMNISETNKINNSNKGIIKKDNISMPKYIEILSIIN